MSRDQRHGAEPALNARSSLRTRGATREKYAAAAALAHAPAMVQEHAHAPQELHQVVSRNGAADSTCRHLLSE